MRKGETLYSLSRRYDVPLRTLVAANGLKSPYTLAVGQRLSVPSARVHTVAKGETGYSISRRYGVTVSALMQENQIRPPYTLAIGQTLRLPGGAGGGVTTASVNPTVVTSTPNRGRSVPRATPPPRSSSGFDWPVSGKLASRYGPKQDGLHNDGINIIARQGTPVKASDAGVVVYASNALQGYGNLLLVKHSGGWITAYAHNERLLVRQGQQVTKGQVIARVGNTGGVSEPQLHFEIRKGRQALDPLRYLQRMSAAASP
ncbi:peptidoglycan DD-metalloendopeptidase family protein [Kordiimonas sp.]|uniref:peptidoglycan DD-metalloendopeptidase family protein n=1 Tax=Kordiimonas sp. TaxID=1970157 RepID=UPI003A929037